jgi:hypothetical protein
MKRRVFLRSVGAAAAGLAVGLRASRVRASPLLPPVFRSARSRGKPLIVATILSADERQAFLSAQDVIRLAPDRELAVRLLLVDVYVISDAEEIHLLTGARAKAEPTSLAMIDGQRPRLVQEAHLDGEHPRAGLERFLRDTVPLSAAWLEQHVAAISRRDPNLVKRLRAQIAAGEPLGAVAQAVPAVVALEAVRRKGADRDKLFADLVTPAPQPKPVVEPKPSRGMIDCGLGAQLINPLGQRFASVFTNRPHGRGRNHPST